MLDLSRVTSGYGAIRVLHDVSLEIAAGEFVGVIGPNGAGKSTLLRTIAGNCAVHAGDITFEGQDLKSLADYQRASLGIAHVPEGRRIWPSLSVHDTLLMGSWRLPDRQTESAALLAMVLDLFPRLKERLHQRSAVLSGGEQQMLAIGRALMSKPKLILVDEPSTGLAPLMMEIVIGALRRLRQDAKIAILLVEQRIQNVLDLCNRFYILNRGQLIEPKPGEHLTRSEIEAAYFDR
ncbi:MAG TPA: ABC transporter ATP-binding protein [Pseudolabrys sp.]|nr:ABC transporter ATP-binding protein [Pseudolabrys sp.]